jgi:hypothetical protein
VVKDVEAIICNVALKVKLAEKLLGMQDLKQRASLPLAQPLPHIPLGELVRELVKIVAV